MGNTQPNNPLHGKTLESILISLIEAYGFEKLGFLIRIKCFNENPDLQSSLKFLRKTPWARKKVEDLFLEQKEINLRFILRPNMVKLKKRLGAAI
ncbi:VF530 family protein [Daejeonella lutea]|uniref:Uncharacterized conserved protein n=1 Tax=Daejeonella lutea TaxID=572036 RepID=A0A1T5AMC0_9SPHI|nr:VF530 family protein [Daejeonella lutea]SKB36152.1 Uncharacterized conserved protein [Daejeonella lutea]